VDVCRAIESAGDDASAMVDQVPWFERAFGAVCARIDESLGHDAG
jgi:hypothetical protein